MFKLSEESPTQHIAILAVAGAMILLSVIDAAKGPSDDSSNKEQVVLDPQGSRYQNPRLSWYEKVFCRGYQRSLNCGFTFYHPMRATMEAQGQRIIEKGAPDGVVVYRGYLKGNRDSLNGKIEFDGD